MNQSGRATLCQVEGVNHAAFSERIRVLLECWYRMSRSRRPQHEQVFWSSLTDHSFEHANVPVSVRSLGQGPAILLLHGVGGRGSQFMRVAEALAQQGWRALMLDLYGQDHQRPHSFRMETTAQVLLELVRREGPISGVVTHSMGNLWIWYAMARGLAIPQFVSLCGVFHASWVHERFRRFHQMTDDEFRGLQTALVQSEGAESIHLQDIANCMQCASRPSRALIIHATADEVVPAQQGRAYAAAWPDAGYREIDGVTHAEVMHSMDTIFAITEFFGQPKNTVDD